MLADITLMAIVSLVQFFRDLGYKSQWCADGCLAEVPERLVVLLLLLARLVEKPTWHAAATCLGHSQQGSVIKLRHSA